MAKILLSEATRLVAVSKPTLYRHVQENKFSWEKDEQGRKVVDPAELERFYGKLKNPNKPDNLSDNYQIDSLRQNENGEILAVLRAETAHFKQEINELRQDKQDLKEERDKLLGIVEKQTYLEDKRQTSEEQLPNSKVIKELQTWVKVCATIAAISILLWALSSTGFSLDFLKL